MKKLTTSLLMATSLLAVAACGETSTPTTSKSEDESGQASTNSNPVSSNTEKPTSVEFSFWYTVGQGLQEGIAEKAEDFEALVKENEGVDVSISLEYQGAYKDIKEKIEGGFSTGNLPSLAVAYPDHVASYLSNESGNTKYVINLDDYINDEEVGFGKEAYLGDTGCTADDIVEAFYREGQAYAKEGTYSLPWMKSSEIMFYNLDAVKRCFGIGVKNAEVTFNADIKTEADVIDFVENMSWDTLMELSEFIKTNKATILPELLAPVMYDSDSNLFISKMYQEEIPYASIGDDGKGIIDFESGDARTRTEELVTKYTNDIKNGLLTTKILQEGKYSSDFFTSEQVVFAIGSSGGTGYNAPDAASFEYKIARVPASNDNPLYVTQGPTLTIINNPADSAEDQQNKALYAWKFLKYLTNTEVNEELCVLDSQGYIPMRNSCYESEFFTSFLEEETIYSEAAAVLLNDVDGCYIASDSFNGSSDLRDQCGNILASVIGGKTVSEAVGNAINEAKKKLG